MECQEEIKVATDSQEMCAVHESVVGNFVRKKMYINTRGREWQKEGW